MSDSGWLSPTTRIESVFPPSIPDDGLNLDQGSDVLDESGADGNPLFRWMQLQKISQLLYSPESRESIGFPTSLAVSRSIVFGTSRGLLLVFDFKQKLSWRLGNPALSVQHGGITTVAISADGVWAAAGFSKGLIMIWELRGGRTIATILPKPAVEAGFFKRTPSRSAHTPGSSIMRLSFAGNRRRLVSVDVAGVALVHSLSSSIVGTSTAARPLFKRGLKAPDPILCVEPLVNIGSNHYHEKAGLLVVVTLRTLTLFRTRPKLEPLAAFERSHLESGMSAQLGPGHDDFYQHGACASVSWCHLTDFHRFGSSALLLAVGWGNYLSILRVSVTERGTEVVELGHLACEYGVVELFWINPRNVVVFDHRDITHIFDVDNLTSPTTLGPYSPWQPVATTTHPPAEAKGLRLHPSINHSTRAHKGKIYVLGWNAVFLAKPITWFEHVMGLVRDRNPVGAIRLATHYLREGAPFYFCQLPEDAGERARVIKGQLQHLIVASQAERWQGLALGAEAVEFVRVCMEACIEMDALDLLFQEVYEGFRGMGLTSLFFVQLQHLILHPTPTTVDVVDLLPPSLVKEMLAYFRTDPEQLQQLEQVLFRLNLGSVDLNYAIETCRQLKLVGGLVYLWSVALSDFISPIMEVFALWSDPSSLPPWVHSWDLGEPPTPTSPPESKLAKLLLGFLLDSASGRSFPTRQLLATSSADLARRQLWDLLVAESCIELQGSRLVPPAPKVAYSNFPYFVFFIDLNPQKFARILEVLLRWVAADSTAQAVVAPCIHLLTTGSIPIDLCVLLANAYGSGKISLDRSILDQVMELLLACSPADSEAFSRQEAAIAALLSKDASEVYPEIHSRLERAGIFRPLYELHRQRHELRSALSVCFKCPSLHSLLYEVTRAIPAKLEAEELAAFAKLLLDNFETLVQVDAAESIVIAEKWLEGDHDGICSRLSTNPGAQFKYMQTLLTHHHEMGPSSLQVYLELLCQKDPHNVLPFLMDLASHAPPGFNSSTCISTTRRYAVTDATVWLLEQAGAIDAAMTEILSMSWNASQGSSLTEALRIQGVGEIAVGLCERTHLSCVQTSTPEGGQCEMLYARLLGKVIELYRLLNESKVELAKEICPALIQSIFDSILRPPAAKNLRLVSVPRILSNLMDTNSSCSEFGEFRDIILGIISTCQTEGSWLHLASKLQSQDLFKLVNANLLLRCRGRRGFAPRCLLCRDRLVTIPTPETPGVMMFHCGHLVHASCSASAELSSEPACPKCHGPV
ncbi:Vacuolar protein sorting-associated protein 8 [Massospora cicadina]|nr:Vacuolar protein sorting-associated protein 8 [Massospora cicadina]